MLRFISFLLLFLCIPVLAVGNEFINLLTQAEQRVRISPNQARELLLPLASTTQFSQQSNATLVRYYYLRAKLAKDLSLNDESLEFALTGLSLAANRPEFKKQALRLTLIVLHFQLQTQAYSQAKELIDHSMSTLSYDEDKSEHAALLLFKAKIYQQENQSDLALLSYKAAYQLALQSDDEALKQLIALNLAGRLLILNDIVSAEALLEKSNQYYEKNQYSVENLVVQIKLAQLASSKGDGGEALRILLNARPLSVVVDSGLYRLIIELSIAELQLQSRQIIAVGSTLQTLQELQKHIRRADDKDRLLLIKARYRLATDDFSGLNELLADDNSLVISDDKKSNATTLELLKIKANGLAADGQFKQAYQILSENRQHLVTENRRRNFDNLQHQKLLFDLAFLQQKNRDLNWSTVLQQTEIDRHAQALSQLNLKLLFVGCIAGLALVLIILLYRNRQQFYKLTYQDQLTGLYNRRYLFLVFNKLQRKFVSKKQPLTALMLDLDHFKRVNDEFGHGVGDEVLVNFALCCKRVLPDDSVIIRLGGEEVLVLLPDKHYGDGFKMAETLRLALEKMCVTTPVVQYF
ncbi:MAG: diguanylate cyclase [Psychrobium sp.]|nr:diguanylate cyclase [Psychrobium sp.]